MSKKIWQKRRIWSTVVAAIILLTSIPVPEVYASTVSSNDFVEIADESVSVNEEVAFSSVSMNEEDDTYFSVSEGDLDVNINEINIEPSNVNTTESTVEPQENSVSEVLTGEVDELSLKGDTIPVNGDVMKPNFSTSGEGFFEASYILEEDKLGTITVDDRTQPDWAYALCSALESNLKMKNQGENVDIDINALIDYLYSSDKDVDNDKYGKISTDLVIPSGEDKMKGNVHTAMWAVASGYAVKDTVSPQQKFRLNNIYLYQGMEWNQIKAAIKNRGEVVTSIYRDMDDAYFQINEISTSEYKTSYFYPEKPIGTGVVEHTVSIIGWDDNYDKEMFKNSAGKIEQNGAWLVKDALGYNGEYYYWISYEDFAFKNENLQNNGGVFCYSFDIEKVDDYSHTYQYDGGSSYFMYGVTGYTKAVNVFPKANLNEIIEEISFGTYTRNAKYKIQVYLNAEPVSENNSSLILNTPLFEKPIETEMEYSNWGYYTIDLSQYEELFKCQPYISSTDANQYYAVEVEIVAGKNFIQNDIKSFWIDGMNAVEPQCTVDNASRGQSYIWNGRKWIDFGQDAPAWENYPQYKGANIRIKAHTKENIAIIANEGKEVWVGKTLNLSTNLTENYAGNTEVLQWSVDNEQIATVTADGTLQSHVAGYVNVTVVSENYGSDTVQIMVKDVEYQQELQLISNSINLEKRKAQIIPTFYPKEYEPVSIEYSISADDEDYVYVDSTGVITAKSTSGTKENIVVTMVIRDDFDIVQRQISVRCYQVPKDFYIVNDEGATFESYDVKILEQLQLGVVITEPTNAISDINWKSSDTSIAYVSKDGKVYTRQPGTAVISAFSEDNPTVQKSVTINVKNRVSQIVLSDGYIYLMPNENKRISAQIFPEEMNSERIVWSICDLEGNDLGLTNDVVNFDEETLTLTAGDGLSSQLSEVKLYAECDGTKSSCYVKVGKTINSFDLSFSENEILSDKTIVVPLIDDKTVSLYTYVNNEPVDMDNELIFYSSSNNSIATVTSKGEITPRQVGTVYITAKTKDGFTSMVTLTITSQYDDKQLLLSVDKNSIAVKEDKKITIFADDIEQTADNFYWETSDENVIKISSDGYVLGVGKGSATIIATDKYNPQNYTEIVLQSVVKVEDIYLKRNYIEIALGNSVALEYHVLPEDANNQDLFVLLPSGGIVSCQYFESYGILEITGEVLGETQIVFSSRDGIEEILTINVVEKNTHHIRAKLDKKYINTKGKEDSTALLTAEAFSFNESQGVSQIFDYYSENPDIAQIDENGVVTGIKEGTARIKVVATDGSNVKTYVDVEVRKVNAGIKSVELNHSKVELNLNSDSKIKLIATVLPENITDFNEITWKSMDETIATVDESGYVTAKGYGKTFIIAESMDDKKSAKCEIKVLPIASQVKLSKVDNQILENLWVNPDSQYQVVVYGSDGKNYTDACEFTSNNTNICVVDEKGLVRPALGANSGTCTITAKLKDDLQGRKVSFKVTIVSEKQIADIRVIAKTPLGEQEINTENPLYLAWNEGQEIPLQAYAIDREGNYIADVKLKWNVSDKKVISVKEPGNDSVTLKVAGSGNTTLTCTVQDKKKNTISIPVYVLDVTPVFEVDNITVNLQKEEQITIPKHVVDGVNIEDISIAYIEKDKSIQTEGFNISYNSLNQICKLSYEPENLKKGNYVVTLKSKVSFVKSPSSDAGDKLKALYHGQEEIITTTKLRIKVIDQQPKVKIKIPNINVFYKNAETKIGLTTSEEITDIVLSDYKDNSVTKSFSVYSDSMGVWLQANTDKKGTYQAVFDVYLKDYINPVSVKCNIKAIITKPQLQATPGSLFMYKPENVSVSPTLSVLNVTEGIMINVGDGYAISKGGTITGQDIVMNELNYFGKKKIVLSVTNPILWNGEVNVTVPVTIENENKISLEADTKKITINKRIQNDSPTVNVFMKQSNLSISRVEEVTILDSKNKLYSDIAWVQEANSKGYALKFMAKDNCLPGKYQAMITVQSEQKIYQKKISIVVVDKAPNVKVKLSGKIDLHDRVDTYMTGKLTISNSSCKITDVISERSDFSTIYDKENEQFILTLSSNADISNKKQAIILNIYLDNGMVLRKTVNVTLNESKVKWGKQQPLIMYKDRIGKIVDYKLTIDAPSTLNLYDTDITITSVPKGISAGGVDGKLRVRIDDESVKAGKYKISYTVKFKSSAKNSAPIKRELLIQVK